MLKILKKLLSIGVNRKKIMRITGLAALGAFGELLGVVAIIPLVQIITHNDSIKLLLEKYHAPAFLLEMNVAAQSAILLLALLALLGTKTYLSYRVYCSMVKFALAEQGRVSNKIIEKGILFDSQNLNEASRSEFIKNAILESDQYAHKVILPFVTLISELSVLLTLFAVLLFISPMMFVIGIGSVGVLNFLYVKANKNKMLQIGKQQQISSDQMIATASEIAAGNQVIRMYGNEQHFFDVYEAVSKKYTDNIALSLQKQVEPRYVVEGVFLAVFVLSAFVAIAQGKTDTLILALAVYGIAAARAMPGVNRILTAFNLLKQGQATLNLLVKEMGQRDYSPQKPVDKIKQVAEVLQADNVCFGYKHSNSIILNNLSFSARRGQILGIMGRSGVGKSTLLRLLLGLAKPERGQISLNGTPILEHFESWRDKVGYVPQDSFLTKDTIKNNIIFYRKDRGQEWLDQVLRMADLEQFVDSQVLGLATEINDRSNNISGGERQRICIARALYGDPQILLFDELTSSLDAKSEDAILKILKRIQDTRIIIVISHKSRTLQACDVVYELKAGHLILADDVHRQKVTFATG